MLSRMATIRQKQSTSAITILTHQRHRVFQRTANAELMIATLFRYRDQGRFLYQKDRTDRLWGFL